MGVIARQGIKNSLVKYLTISIGLISLVFIYPLDMDLYGQFGFVIDTALLFSPLVLFGSHLSSIKYFSQAKEKSNTAGFYSFLMSHISIFGLLFLVIFLVFDQQIIQFFNNGERYSEVFIIVCPVTLLTALMFVQLRFISNYKRIVIPGFLEQLIKVSLPIFFLLIYFNAVSISNLSYLLIGHFLAVNLLLFLYLRSLDASISIINFSSFRKSIDIREYARYSGYMFFGGIGAMLAFRLDNFMVTSITDFTQGAEYRIASILGGLVAIPSMALYAIASPILSQAIYDKDFDEVGLIYRKGSINLLIAGVFVFLGIYSCIDMVIYLMPEQDLSFLKKVVLIIGSAKLVDMVFGLNGHILVHSKHYKYNFIFIIILGLSNIFLNYFLIHIYGPIGASIATFCALLLFNFIKYFFLKSRLSLQPFSRIHIILITLFVLLAGFIYLDIFNVHIITKSILHLTISLGVFCSYVILSKSSPDINIYLQQIINTFKK